MNSSNNSNGHRCAVATFAAAVVLLSCEVAHAAATLSFEFSPPNLTGLAVGQPVLLDVNLGGLPAGEQLDSLSATIAYDAALLGPPTITRGTIIPNPLDDPLDLVTTAAPGLADVAFLTFGAESADRITSNGVFFSLSMNVIGTGSGTISFDFVNATRFNVQDPDSPLRVEVGADPSLNFTSVPEPSMLSLAAISVVSLLGMTRPSRMDSFAAR